MKYIKKYENIDDELLDFEDEPISKNPLEDYIIGQKVTSICEIQVGYSLTNGLEFENGYKMVYYGGGCSGNDVNTSYILDYNNNIVATFDY